MEVRGARFILKTVDGCEFTHSQPHEWHCTTHDRTVIGSTIEPVYCTPPETQPDPRDATPTMGYIAIAGKRPSEIARILRLRIEELDRKTDSRYSMDYCSPTGYRRDGTKDDSPIRDRYRWAIVYPVTGGSEGHYLHVAIVYQRDADGRPLDENQYRDIALVKIFGGWQAAAELSGIIGRWLDA